MQLTARLEGVNLVRGNIQRLIKDHPNLAAKALRTSATHILVPAIRGNIRKHRSIFTGEYHGRQTAKAEVHDNTTVFVEVGALGVPYGLNIEQGAAPHIPNQTRVEEYVRKKMGLSGTRAASTVAAIMATIAAYGTRARPNIIPAWNANSSRFWADFVKRMRVALYGAITPP